MKKLKEFIKEIWIYIVLIIVVLLTKKYVITFIRVNGNSMLDTLRNNDIMILNKIGYKYNDVKRFDIVVIENKNELIIKRVIGLPGEYIEYKNNKLYVNGKRVKENFANKYTYDYSIEELNETEIPANSYFVLGDNRTNSLDSRVIGFISKKQILGKTSFTIFPFGRIGNKK